MAGFNLTPEANQVRPISPTLEDVFVTLSRAAETGHVNPKEADLTADNAAGTQPRSTVKQNGATRLGGNALLTLELQSGEDR